MSAMWVESIEFGTDRRGALTTTVSLDGLMPVYSADVTLSLTCDGEEVLNQTQRASSRGATFQLRTPGPGHYVATITALEARGRTWDESRGIITNSYELADMSVMWVESIEITSTRWGAVMTTVRVDGVMPVYSAVVTLSLTRDGEEVLNQTRRVSSRGAIFQVWNAGPGDYVATVTALEAAGRTWDESRGVTSESMAV